MNDMVHDIIANQSALHSTALCFTYYAILYCVVL